MHAELAGITPRAAAYLIDFSIRIAIMIVLSIIAFFFGQMGVGLILISWFIIEWGYAIPFEVLWNGQTPGKKKMGLVVFNDDLTPVTWSTSTLRNLLRAADMLPMGYLFGCFSVVLSQHSQRPWRFGGRHRSRAQILSGKFCSWFRSPASRHSKATGFRSWQRRPASHNHLHPASPGHDARTRPGTG